MLQFILRWTLENHPSDKASVVWAKCRQRERSISRYIQYLQYLDRESPVITFHWSRSSLSRCPEIIIAPTVATCLCLKWKNHFTANPSSRTINSWRLENLKNIVKNIYDGKNKDERFQCCTWSRDKPVAHHQTISLTPPKLVRILRRYRDNLHHFPAPLCPRVECCHCSGVRTSPSLMKGHRSHAPPPWRGSPTLQHATLVISIY